MGKKKKQLEKYKSNPTNVSFREIASLLEYHGFILTSRTGSHFVVEHNKYNIFLKGESRTIPLRRPHVLPIYVKRAVEWIERVIEIEEQD